MEVVTKKIEELIPYENNPRINSEAVKYVAESIKQFGFKVPIVIDKDNVIVTGHTRLKAAIELGMKEVPVVIADDLTPEQIKAFRIADNKVAEQAKWDFDKLKIEIGDMPDIDFKDFGFTDFEIDYLKEGSTFNDEEFQKLFEEERSVPKEEKKPNKIVHTVQCPHCGETFEVEVSE